MPSGVVPKSVTSTMFGWPIRDAAFASWTKRLIDHRVARGEHHAHAALADLALDEVAAIERLADQPIIFARGRLAPHRLDDVRVRALRRHRPELVRRVTDPALGRRSIRDRVGQGTRVGAVLRRHDLRQHRRPLCRADLGERLTVVGTEARLGERAPTSRALEDHRFAYSVVW
jgi:hypothetical protein